MLLKKPQQQTSLITLLMVLTVLFVIWQLAFFIIHYLVTQLLDSLVQTSVVLQLLHPVILIPLGIFILLQCLAYALFVIWIAYVSISLAERWQLSKGMTRIMGVIGWGLGCALLVTANAYYYPASFFATAFERHPWLNHCTPWLVWLLSSLLGLATLFALLVNLKMKRRLSVTSLLIAILLLIIGQASYEYFVPVRHAMIQSQAKPNVILIGLDSLRPDYIHYFGNHSIKTPHIDQFLQGASTYTNAYTPLARTYPAWVSILTAQYPIHHTARNNLVYPSVNMTKQTVAKHFQQAGYETIYATDEKRFSNITSAFGFDQILGPKMGVNDFLLGGLTDFPMTNLLLKLPISRYLFPYHYGNRAAHITYDPDHFIQIIKAGLRQRTDKPLFLSIHLCLSHWPFTWARDGQNPRDFLATQYFHSVEAVDRQLGDLMQVLKTDGLLDNSIVVLLSDHGTGLGLPGDRLLSSKQFVGDSAHLKWVQRLKLSNNYKGYSINTSYGQGTNVLSMTQYHVLLAFKRYGSVSFPVQQLSQPVSLLDISPTLLNLLSLPAMEKIDGMSLASDFATQSVAPVNTRPLFLETGDSMTEIETDHIYVEKVIKHQIGIYTVNHQDGLLMMDAPAATLIVKNKQLAIRQGDWMLAHFPARSEKRIAFGGHTKQPVKQKTIIYPPYFVLINLKTKQWTIGFESSLAKSAPLATLLGELKGFYQGEV